MLLLVVVVEAGVWFACSWTASTAGVFVSLAGVLLTQQVTQHRYGSSRTAAVHGFGLYHPCRMVIRVAALALRAGLIVKPVLGRHHNAWVCLYDVQVRMTSYASRNPYLATQGEVMKNYGVEWDRQLLTTLGVANNRLYELRLQTNSPTNDADKPQLDLIRESFTVKEVEE